MQTVEYWRWILTDPDTGRRVKTRHRMPERDALALDPGAQRIEGSLELRQVPAPGEHVPSQRSG